MKYCARVILLLLLLSAVTAQAFDSVDDTRRWAIAGVNVVDPATGTVESNQTIVIRQGVIEAIGARESIDPESLDLTVQLDGMYVIPGLWDMHIHLRGGPESIAANEQWLPQYLGFGVTTVRDAGGDLPSSVLHWRAEIAQGFRTGPRIFTALRKIDGSNGTQPGSIEVASPADIAAGLDYLEIAGADFVKVYDYSLPADLYPIAISQAEARGFKTSAHVPPWVPFADLIEAGLDSVEHGIYLAKAADPDDRSVSASTTYEVASEYASYYHAIREAGDRADKETLQKSFERMIGHGTAVVSTLNLEQQFLAHLDGVPASNPRREETPPLVLSSHDETLDFMTSIADEITEDQRMIVRRTRGFLKAASDAGVMMLAGTDTGVNNPRLYAGDSLHTELEVLVAIGLTPLEALRSATMRPAQWLGVYPWLGAIPPDSAADLVILEANPLDDIANTRRLTAVVQQGVYYDAGELEELRTLRRD